MLTTTNWRHAGAGARRASRTRGQQLSRSAQLQQLAHSWHRLARPGLSNPAPSPRCVTARAAAGPGSESDEEPDASLTEELAHMKDPNRMRKAAEHLELAWQIQNAVVGPRAAAAVSPGWFTGLLNTPAEHACLCLPVCSVLRVPAGTRMCASAARAAKSRSASSATAQVRGRQR